jgi:hypothetical protein
MDKEKISRIVRVISEQASTPEDMAFVRNNLEDFHTFLYNMATNELVKEGVSPEKVEMLLDPLLGIAKMWGASSFADYQVLAELEGE